MSSAIVTIGISISYQSKRTATAVREIDNKIDSGLVSKSQSWLDCKKWQLYKAVIFSHSRYFIMDSFPKWQLSFLHWNSYAPTVVTLKFTCNGGSSLLAYSTLYRSQYCDGSGFKLRCGTCCPSKFGDNDYDCHCKGMCNNSSYSTFTGSDDLSL